MAIALVHKKTLLRSRLFRLVGNAKGWGYLVTGRTAINYLLRSLKTLFKSPSLPLSSSPSPKSSTDRVYRINWKRLTSGRTPSLVST
jgi:hypothetical protein